MSTAAKHYLTPEEYLAIERAAETKSEYFQGEMFALAGAGYAHNLLVSKLIELLAPDANMRGCKVLPSDMRVKINALGKYTYPDVTVICGKAELEDAHGDTLLNPAVLFEILSESTERYDRGTKFAHYQKLPSLRVYVLVAQDRARVEVYTRQDGGFWRYEAFEGPEAMVALEPPGSTFTLAQLYEGILTVPEAAADSAGS
jgi:Uma2 family endonuclease